METIDVSVEDDARRMICGLLYYEATHDEWPVGSAVSQMSAYKAAPVKAEMMARLVKQGKIEIIKESAGGGRIKHRYSVTSHGLVWVAPPEALSPLVFDKPMPLPDDEVEYRIYAYHHTFFEKFARWPNGEERARAFAGEKSKRISPARRRQAYEDLVEDGTLVNVNFWNSRGEYNCYVIVRYSPEYADKHNWLFYAPLDKT
jgi:hypothetical protein